MNRNRKIEKGQNPPLKPTKPKGSVNFGKMTFIDKILRRIESRASVGFQTIPRKSSNVIPQVASSPSIAHAEIQSQIGGSE